MDRNVELNCALRNKRLTVPCGVRAYAHARTPAYLGNYKLSARGAGGGAEGNSVTTSTCQFRPERMVPAYRALGLLSCFGKDRKYPRHVRDRSPAVNYCVDARRRTSQPTGWWCESFIYRAGRRVVTPVTMVSAGAVVRRRNDSRVLMLFLL